MEFLTEARRVEIKAALLHSKTSDAFNNGHQSPLGTTCSRSDNVSHATVLHRLPRPPATGLIEQLGYHAHCAGEGGGGWTVAREEHRGRIWQGGKARVRKRNGGKKGENVIDAVFGCMRRLLPK